MPAGTPHTVQVTVSNLRDPIPCLPGRYRMMSVPLALTGGITEALADDMPDASEWRMFVYDSVHIQIPDNDHYTFEAGRGYWLATRSDRLLDTGPVVGLSVPTDGPYPIVLLPGWNQIGNPFVFPVAWDLVTKPGTVGDPVAFDPTQGEIGGYRTVVPTVLNPFEGYFVHNSAAEPETLWVPPEEATGVPVAATPRVVLADEPPPPPGAWARPIFGVNFATTMVGDTATATLSLVNDGTRELRITGYTFSDPSFSFPSDFAARFDPELVLGAGETMSTPVLFVPSQEGDYAGMLALTSDDLSTSVAEISLDGTGEALTFTLVPFYQDGIVDQGEDARVRVSSDEVDSMRVFYRSGGAVEFNVLPMGRVAGGYLVEIPSEVLTERGLEYKVRAHNGRFETSDTLRYLQIEVGSLVFPTKQPAMIYRMISVPLSMDNALVTGLFTAMLSVEWHIFTYEQSASSNIELPAASGVHRHVELGRAYWLATRNEVELTTDPVGVSTPTEGPYEIALLPGWNQIGSPFAFAVDWDLVMVDTLTSAKAESTLVIERPQRWIPSKDRYNLVAEEDGERVTVLEPFEGYFIFARSPVTLHIPPVALPDAPAVVTLSQAENAPPPAAHEWRLHIVAEAAGISDGGNYVGVRSDAVTGRDRHDIHDAPMSPGKSMSLYFPHIGWERYPGFYTTDFDADNTDGHLWRFDVAKDFSEETAGDEVVVEITGIDDVPEEMQIYLIDRTLDRLVDLREEARYRFFEGLRAFVKRDDGARFVLLVGDDDFVAGHSEDLPSLPTKTVLHQNYPNPFNPSTIIRYEIAQRGRVEIRIYDVTGALVKVLEDRDREPGRYEVGWNAKNERGDPVASGVYLYKMKTNQFVQTKKMILLK
jgi:hypothetical protein